MGEGEEEAGSSSKLESVSKSLAMGLAVVYLLGFLVVARNLSQYGISSITVLKLQYLIAGIWLLLPLAVPFLLVAGISVNTLMFGKKARLAKPRSWVPLRTLLSWRTPLELIILVTPFVILVGILSGFGVNKAFEFYAKTFATERNFGYWVGFLFSIASLATLTWYLIRRGQSQQEEKTKRNYNIVAVYFGTLCLLVLVYYVSFFARNWYPLIPYSLGGGKPASVVFLLKTGEDAGESPVIADSSGKRSVPYRLLFATDKTFVVLSPNNGERAIEFDRDAVVGVVMLRAEQVPTPKPPK